MVSRDTTLNVYTHSSAVSDGHPFRWTGDHLAQAVTVTNEFSRPWGPSGETPAERWRSAPGEIEGPIAEFSRGSSTILGPDPLFGFLARLANSSNGDILLFSRVGWVSTQALLTHPLRALVSGHDPDSSAPFSTPALVPGRDPAYIDCAV